MNVAMETSTVMIYGIEGITLQVELEVYRKIVEAERSFRFMGKCFRKDENSRQDKKLKWVRD